MVRLAVVGAGEDEPGAADRVPITAAGGGREIAEARQRDLERLGDEIAELAAHIHAATHRLLVRLRRFDREHGWGRGFRSCAEWLSWRTGIAPGAAREKVRVARALEALPGLNAAMERGELSYSKARALTRVATPANESRLLELARHATAAHVEKVVRAWRRVDRLEEEKRDRARHEARYLSLYPDDDGSYVLRARLDPEVGELLSRALEAARDALRREERSGPERRDEAGSFRDPTDRTPRQRAADAMGLLAEIALRSGVEPGTRPIGTADRFQVVVHVDAEALVEAREERESVPGSGTRVPAETPAAGRSLPDGGARVSAETPDKGQSLLESGVRVPAETSRRLACDAGRVVMFHGAGGEVLSVGRRTRTVPHAIRRALEHRDRGCRFPGCGSRYCDAHHIRHWADGGETRLSNLCLLCVLSRLRDNSHKSVVFPNLVSPPSAQWITWCASVKREPQPGKRQPRSRTSSARLSAGDIVRVLRPTSSTVPSGARTSRIRLASHESLRDVSAETRVPSSSSERPGSRALTSVEGSTCNTTW